MGQSIIQAGFANIATTSKPVVSLHQPQDSAVHAKRKIRTQKVDEAFASPDAGLKSHDNMANAHFALSKMSVLGGDNVSSRSPLLSSTIPAHPDVPSACRIL